MVVQNQRQFQRINDLQSMPHIDWTAADEMLKYEGMYIFGGLLPGGVVNHKLYMLRLVFCNSTQKANKLRLQWTDQDELEIQGAPPKGRVDHGFQRYKNNIILFGGKYSQSGNDYATSLYLLQLDSLTWVKL